MRQLSPREISGLESQCLPPESTLWLVGQVTSQLLHSLSVLEPSVRVEENLEPGRHEEKLCRGKMSWTVEEPEVGGCGVFTPDIFYI